MATAIPTSDIRNNWSDIVNRAQYAGERFVVERHGRDVAAIISVDDLAALEGVSGTAGSPPAERSPQEVNPAPDNSASLTDMGTETHLTALRDHIAEADEPKREAARLIYRLIQDSDVAPQQVLIAAAYLCE